MITILLPASIYYRLKEADKDNGFRYSPVKSVIFSAAYRVVVAPNPARDIIHVYIYGNNVQAVILLMDASGKIIKNINTKQSHSTISIAGLSKGLYFIKVTGKNKTTVLKLSVL